MAPKCEVDPFDFRIKANEFISLRSTQDTFKKGSTCTSFFIKKKEELLK
jgi:hypothetical protein